MSTRPKRTLAERIAELFRTPEESKIYNPLGQLKGGGLKVGAIVGLDTLDLAGKDFNLLAIHEGKIFADGQTFRMADYDLEHTPGPSDDGPVLQRRLRVFERPSPPPGESPLEMALLWLDDSGPYNPGLEAECRRDDGKFFIAYDDPALEDEEFDRVGNLRMAREVAFTTLADRDGDGTVRPDELGSRSVDMYDYWREAFDEAGQAFCKYAYVDVDRDTHSFEVWMGEEVSAYRILF